MGKYRKLLQNTWVFTIANMGSSLVSFLFVRFYTELLTTEQYGTIDILTTSSSLLIPVITLAIVEAVLRFSIDSEDKGLILSNGLIVALIGNAVFAVVGPIVMGFTTFRNYSGWLCALILFSSLDSICAQFTRGTNRTKIYALSGVVKTVTLIACNILFLLGLKMKIEGYLLSLVVSEAVTIAFLMGSARLYKHIRMHIDKPLLRSMLSYSAPLIVSSLSWWVMNASDKYVILLYIGAAANGVYAVAHKIPTIINLFSGLFMQAWQLSAVEEATSKDKGVFFTEIFDAFSAILILIASVLIFLIKPIMSFLVAKEYGSVWCYSPFLIIAMVFSSFAGFIGTNYSAMKKTSGALRTTLVGSIVNVILNLFLVKRFGLNGTAFATMISFLVMFILRAVDTKGFVRIKYRYTHLAISFGVLLIQALLVTFDYTWDTIPHIICVVLVLVVNKDEVFSLLKRFRHKFAATKDRREAVDREKK